MTASASRREFLRRSASLAALGGAAPLGLSLAAMGQASAATATGYKAVICVFLAGGNDAFNTVLATDADSWSAYTAARGATGDSLGLRAPGTSAQSGAAIMADRLGGALPITPVSAQGRSFALHPVLGGMRDLFADGRLAVIANAGPLIQPTTKAQYTARSAPLPRRLFSHNDQAVTWQSFSPEGASSGWGGRMADLFLANNGNSMFSSITLDGGTPWGHGAQARSYQMALSGAVPIGDTDGRLFSSATAQNTLHNLLRVPRTGHVLAADHAAVFGRSIDAEAVLRNALPAAAEAPWGTPGLALGQPDPVFSYVDPVTRLQTVNPLAAKLQPVLRMIAARNTLDMARQVFFVQLDGFDTHSTQHERHATLLAQLSHGLTYLDSSLRTMGLSQNVTTFTASDFGRSFTSNGDGSDHGWGGHQFVMGGAVRGQQIYGRFPTYGVSDGAGGYNSNDQLRNGALLPASSVDQFGATLARWFGVSDTEQLDIFPSLGNFAPPARNLGFMA